MSELVVDDPTFIDRAATEADRLLIAAESTWDRPVPHCPDWTVTELVRHMGGIFAWMATIVSTGEPASFRSLDPAPAGNDELKDWYRNNLHRALGALAGVDPATRVWTFSSLGDHRAGWWRRRLAVEVSIHRWDVEHVVALLGGAEPTALDGTVAAAGIDEFVTEFLPGLLTRGSEEVLPTGTVHLRTDDVASDTWLDLSEAHQILSLDVPANTSISGTRSDILLWLTNRQSEALEVQGDRRLLTQWTALRR